MTGKSAAIVVAVSLAVLALAFVPAAVAGKGGGGSSISLVLLNGATEAHFGGQVTFTVSTSATKPWVNLSCYQNGVWVSGQWHGFWDGYQYGQVFTLGPTQSWTGGAADCTARLATISKTGRETTLATTSFHVYA